MKIRFGIPLALALCISLPVLAQHPEGHPQEHPQEHHDNGTRTRATSPKLPRLIAMRTPKPKSSTAKVAA